MTRQSLRKVMRSNALSFRYWTSPRMDYLTWDCRMQRACSALVRAKLFRDLAQKGKGAKL